MKKYFILTITSLLLFLSACTQNNTNQLKISTNPWIGYTPLFYAQEKGYLDDLNMKLITNVSLAESTTLYDVGKVDMLTGTQHEYYALKRAGHNIVPIVLLDRSYGGDMILANKTIPEIKKAKKVTVYLEIDSINVEVLKDFLSYYHIDKSAIKFINKDQAQMLDLTNHPKETMLIVTYSPYDIPLKKRGFDVIASTKESNSIIVIDALYTDISILKNEPQRLQRLKAVIDRSVAELQSDTKASYELVKSYLGDLSYNDYLESLQLIEWINKPSKELLKRIEPMGYTSQHLISIQ